MKLPKYVYIHHGWYIYKPWDRKAKKYSPQQRLAPDTAHYGEIMDAYNRVTAKCIFSLRTLWIRYRESKQFLDLASSTQINYESYVETIHRTKFSNGMSLLDIAFNQWSIGLGRQYLDVNEHRPIVANREIQFMRSLFSWGFEREYCPANPLRGIKLKHKSRDRYVEDWEYALVKNIAQPRMKAFMTIAYKCRLRPSEVRGLETKKNIRDDGLLCNRGKGSKDTIVEWDDELWDACHWSEVISPWIVHDGKGHLWRKNAFDLSWQRLMKHALKKGLTERFTAHDLKAKGISDDEGDAQKGAGHIDGRVTEKVYRRKPAKVSPIKSR